MRCTSSDLIIAAVRRWARESSPLYCWSMIFSENRYPPRIKSGAGFFGIKL
jgi:hypothetical protein